MLENSTANFFKANKPPITVQIELVNFYKTILSFINFVIFLEGFTTERQNSTFAIFTISKTKIKS